MIAFEVVPTYVLATLAVGDPSAETGPPPPPAYAPSLDFSDARNSMYVGSVV